jgi:shikimate 5-dehydrogenase
VPLADLDPADHELLVHATPLGRSADDEPPFDVGRLPAGAAVVDMVYGGEPTPLIEAARRRGLLAVDGRAVLLHQALDQFRLMTGRELPAALGRELLGLAAAAPAGETAR